MAAYGKKQRAGSLILAAVILLAACGKGDSVHRQEDGKGRESTNPLYSAPETDYSYVPEYTELGGGENISFQDICFAGDCLYYDQVFFDVVNQKNKPVLKQYSLTENKILRERDSIAVLDEDRRRQTGKYCVLENGDMYAVESEYSYSNNSRLILLCAYDRDWNLRWEQDITAVVDGVEQYGQADYMAVNPEGRICLGVGNTLCFFDPEGKHQGNTALENEIITGLWTDRDGNAYVCCQDLRGMGPSEFFITELDFETRKTGSSYYNISAGDIFGAGQEGKVLIGNGSHLFQYDLAEESGEELLEWAGCGLNGSCVEAVSICEDGGLLAFYQDFSEGKSFLVRLKRVETALLPEKTRITVGCLTDNQELQYAAAAFNRQSGSCCVTLIHYARKEDGTEADPGELVNALGIALATGIDCPDLLVLDDMEAYRMDVESMAGNGAFADLEPFLESSTLLKREDYLESALECYRYHGVLIGIPCELRLQTIVGNNSQLGQEPGWTPEEMIAYAGAHPDRQLFDGAVRKDILQDCLVFGLEEFIDRDTGQCRFNSEEFRELLAFAGTFPEKYEPQADDRSRGRKIQEGDILLYKAAIEDFYRIQEHQVMFDGQAVYIGYPAAGGSGCIAECFGALALSARCENPEAAWEFMEYYVERVAKSRWRGGFHTRKSLLKQQMEEAMTVSYYLDDEGNPLLDAYGKPVPREPGGVQWSLEDKVIMFRTAAEEEINAVMELIESARPVTEEEDRIIDIIREEAEPFFRGQKSVEEAADIIQSRVQNYMDERYEKEHPDP